MELSRQQRGFRDTGPCRLLLVLLALLAVNAQQLVARTHWHAVPAVSAVADLTSSTDEGAGTHDDCLLCQIAAHAAAAAPPSAQQPLPVLRAFVSHGRTEHRSVVVTKPAHAWQSRGPPAV